jgi:hypothetical protein
VRGRPHGSAINSRHAKTRVYLPLVEPIWRLARSIKSQSSHVVRRCDGIANQLQTNYAAQAATGHHGSGPSNRALPLNNGGRFFPSRFTAFIGAALIAAIGVILLPAILQAQQNAPEAAAPLPGHRLARPARRSRVGTSRTKGPYGRRCALNTFRNNLSSGKKSRNLRPAIIQDYEAGLAKLREWPTADILAAVANLDRFIR